MLPFLSKKQHRPVNSNLNYKKHLFTGFVGLTIINNFIMVRLFLCLINFPIREYYKYIGKKVIIMSRVLLSGDNQITWSFGKHGGWSKGIDIVRFENRLEKITVHTAGKVIKVVNYLDGTNKILDKEGMGYGNYVMVLHKGNFVTLYGHLEHVTVNEGQEINQGTVIGYMGNTGISYGAHLHFEIRKYNRSLENINLHNKDYFGFIDPEPYLNTGLPIGEEKYERVQIGSFLSENNAKRLVEHMRKSGYQAIVKKYGMHYRVQVGAYTIHINAVIMMEKMKALGYKDAYITTY